MSLAMFAAPFNDNSTITLPNSDNSENILNQKRHKRTQKKYPNPKLENFDTNKVNSVLQKIHDNLGGSTYLATKINQAKELVIMDAPEFKI